ncbi:MAG TPA: DUF1992 domain-containing protein [Burkholderiales bacterium]
MLEFLAEQRVQEAIARGELDDLPGAGRPLDLQDDALIPEDLRLAYRILKNAGYVPPEVQALNEIAHLERFIAQSDVDATARAKAVRKLALLKTGVEHTYYSRIVEKLAR